MERHILLVQTNALPGREDEFNEWYTNTHLKDVLQLPGYVAAQRFEYNCTSLYPGEPAVEAPYRFVAVYEIEGDASDAAKALAAARSSMYLSPAMSEVKLSLLYTPVTERMTSQSFAN